MAKEQCGECMKFSHEKAGFCDMEVTGEFSEQETDDFVLGDADCPHFETVSGSDT